MSTDDHVESKNNISLKPTCIASTGVAYCHTISKAAGVQTREANFFHAAQFSADGTTIITHNEDQNLRTFVLPSDLLDEEKYPQHLSATSEYRSPNNVQSYAVYPGFSLQDTSTTVALCASANVPICLRNAFAYEVIHATYNFIKDTTEEYLPARSLTFSQDGTHFVAGSDNSIAFFDCSRNGSDPISSRQLRSGRNARRLGHTLGVAECEGIVSTMSINTDRMLAVGTLSRQVGLYDHEGSGECAATFSVGLDKSEQQVFGGTGITQVKWSPCGTYLLVAERQSDCIQVFDIRNTYQKVSTLTGRRARTTQKLGMDVIHTANAYEAWAGGNDGRIRVWNNPGKAEGLVPPDGVIDAHTAPVSGTLWHPAGVILATCSGTRLPLASSYDTDSDEKSSESSSDDDSSINIPSDKSSDCSPIDRPAIPMGSMDNTLKIWTV